MIASNNCSAGRSNASLPTQPAKVPLVWLAAPFFFPDGCPAAVVQTQRAALKYSQLAYAGRPPN